MSITTQALIKRIMHPTRRLTEAQKEEVCAILLKAERGHFKPMTSRSTSPTYCQQCLDEIVQGTKYIWTEKFGRLCPTCMEALGFVIEATK